MSKPAGYNTPNFQSQDGAWWIGGTLEVASGGQIIADAGSTIDLSAATVTLPDGNVATAKLAAGAVTLPKVSFTGLKVLAAVGKNGAGAITLTGAAVGDRVVAIFGAPTAGGALAAKVPGTDFEATISVVNQVQQSVATDLSGNTYIFVIVPATA